MERTLTFNLATSKIGILVEGRVGHLLRNQPGWKPYCWETDLRIWWQYGMVSGSYLLIWVKRSSWRVWSYKGSRSWNGKDSTLHVSAKNLDRS